MGGSTLGDRVGSDSAERVGRSLASAGWLQARASSPPAWKEKKEAT